MSDMQERSIVSKISLKYMSTQFVNEHKLRPVEVTNRFNECLLEILHARTPFDETMENHISALCMLHYFLI